MPDNEIAPGSGLAERGDVVIVNIFGDATRIAHLLGLDVELPDPDNVDPDYWKRIHADGGYKPRIADKIADPWLSGDPDWALLKRLPWGEVWFDIEEGVKLFVVAADIAHAMDLIDVLRTRGLDLSDKKGNSLVRVMPTRLEDNRVERIRAHMDAAGLVQGFADVVWELPLRRH